MGLMEMMGLGREKLGNQAGRLLFYLDLDSFFYFPPCLSQTGLDPGGCSTSALPLLMTRPHPAGPSPCVPSHPCHPSATPAGSKHQQGE